MKRATTKKKIRARIPNREIDAIVHAGLFARRYGRLEWREQRRVLVWLLDRIDHKQVQI